MYGVVEFDSCPLLFLACLVLFVAFGAEAVMFCKKTDLKYFAIFNFIKKEAQIHVGNSIGNHYMLPTSQGLNIKTPHIAKYSGNVFENMSYVDI